MTGFKTGHWILVALTGAIIVLLLLAPHHGDTVLEEGDAPAAQNEPPTVENEIDSALVMIASEAPMQGILKLRSIAEANPGNFRAQYHLGRFSAQTGQWEKVLERFEQVERIDPGFEEVHYWKGMAYFNLGELQKAKTHLTQYVEGEENNPQLSNEAETMLNQIP